MTHRRVFSEVIDMANCTLEPNAEARPSISLNEIMKHVMLALT
jgi:hypothetical protein